MLWVWLLAQPQLARAPTSGVLRASDFPHHLVEYGESYQISTRTLVAPDGKPIRCEAERSSRKPKLDKYTCDIMVARARFSPIRWIDGTPAHALYRQVIGWTYDVPRAPDADLELAVNELPKGVKRPFRFELTIAVDEQARAVSCSSAGRTAQETASQQVDPVLVRLACAELLKSRRFHVPKDAAGRPLRTIQNISVQIAKQRSR